MNWMWIGCKVGREKGTNPSEGKKVLMWFWDWYEPPPAKTRKHDGAAKYCTRFNPGNGRVLLGQVEKSAYKFTCTICQCSVSCLHQGEKDVWGHIEGKKHCDNVRGLERQQRDQLPALSSLSKTSKCGKVRFFSASALDFADLVAAESVVRMLEMWVWDGVASHGSGLLYIEGVGLSSADY